MGILERTSLDMPSKMLWTRIPSLTVSALIEACVVGMTSTGRSGARIAALKCCGGRR